MKKQIMLAVVGVVLGLAVCAMAGSTKYATGSTSAAITFGPNKSAQSTIRSLNAVTDLEGGAVQVYSRAAGSTYRYAPSRGVAAGVTNIFLANTLLSDVDGLTTGDVFVIVHGNGQCEKRDVSTATTTNITFTTVTTYLTTNTVDLVYDMTLAGYYLVGFDGCAAGTNDNLNLTGDVFLSPADSPLWINCTGTSTAMVQCVVE